MISPLQIPLSFLPPYPETFILPLSNKRKPVKVQDKIKPKKGIHKNSNQNKQEKH